MKNPAGKIKITARRILAGKEIAGIALFAGALKPIVGLDPPLRKPHPFRSRQVV